MYRLTLIAPDGHKVVILSGNYPCVRSDAPVMAVIEFIGCPGNCAELVTDRFKNYKE